MGARTVHIFRLAWNSLIDRFLCLYRARWNSLIDLSLCLSSSLSEVNNVSIYVPYLFFTFVWSNAVVQLSFFSTSGCCSSKQLLLTRMRWQIHRVRFMCVSHTHTIRESIPRWHAHRPSYNILCVWSSFIEVSLKWFEPWTPLIPTWLWF